MSFEIVTALLLGVAITLIGGSAAYALSFSRDKRLKRDELKSMYGALSLELRAIEKGFSKTRNHIPRFGSMNVFTIRGFIIDAPSSISIALENVTFELHRIEEITREDQAYKIAVASSGNTNIEYKNIADIAERSQLIDKVVSEIPDLVKLLELHT